MSATVKRPTALNERLFQTAAIVLTRMDYGEADRIYSLYTPHYGKVKAIAKGARRPLSRLGPSLEYFCHSHVMLARGRDLSTVTGSQMVEPHIGLRNDLDAFGHASHCVEVLDRLTPEGQANPRVFDLLATSLGLLADGLDPFLVSRHYEFALLTLLGYKPELYRCVGCAVDINAEPNGFSSEVGGVMCPRCHASQRSSRSLSVNAQKYLRTIDRKGLYGVAPLKVDTSLRNELEGVLGETLRHAADRDLASLRVWHALRDGAPS